MTINQIIKNTAIMLGLSDVVELIESKPSKTELRRNDNYVLLLRCINLVASNIASNYRPLETSETLSTTAGNRIDFSRLSHSVLKIMDVRSPVTNWRVPFTLFTDHITVSNPGSFRVIYTFVPHFETGNEYNPFQFSDEVLTYGTAAEYAFINGMFSEAQVWNIKLENLLFNTKRKCGENITMPATFRR
ncbi:MAG: hypothetical protein FWE16_01165 [Firmicutes bacterium]|nr:hypothetical protein [Bacillota bacterium]